MLLQLLAGNVQPLLNAVAAAQPSQSVPAPLPSLPVSSPQPPLAPASSHSLVTQSSSASAPPPPPPLALTAPPIPTYHSLRPVSSSLPAHLPPLPQLSSSSAPLNSVVNQARLNHAASSLPRAPALPRRRPRSNAVAPPRLPRAPDINSCLTTSGGVSHLRTINIENGSEIDLFYMRFLWDTFFQQMQAFGLVVIQTSPTTQSVTAHIQDIVHELRLRQLDVDFSPDSVLLAHENQPLAPLYVVNRGVPRPSDNQIRLRRAPVRPTATIGDLAANRLQFAVPGLCIIPHDGQNYLALHFVMRQPSLTAFLSLPGEGQVARYHRCLPQRIYTMFPRDRVHESWPHADGDSSCGESDNELGLNAEDDSDFDNFSLAPTPIPATRVLRSRVPLPSPTAPEVLPVPLALWEQPWIPRTSDVHHTSFNSAAIYQAATSGTPPSPIVYRGESVSEAAEELLAAIGRCVDSGDFTDVLSDDQTAIIYEPGTRRILSSGEGILREVFHVAFTKTLSTSGPWLIPRADNKLSLLFLRSAGFGLQITGPRQRLIGISGALWSLMMIKGLAVDPNGTPTVKAVCDAWKEAGPTGNINTPQIASHLATYLGIEATSVGERDQATHDAMLVEMLYRAVIGSEPPSHCDVIALAHAVRLPCRNGFTFTHFIRGLVGGSDRFLALIMASVVGPLTLISRLSFRTPAPLMDPITAAMEGESLADILGDYFMGSGIPCPGLFEEAQRNGLFPDIVDLSLANRPNFRAQMWTWAV
ncbi:hypothetical protein MVEN_00054100 [Mycena venus]|uniref:Uncharacterized protein n=1 Tax=Mycena venus TaxID=2733690 RepID=A0A8H6Z8Z1_9AGAR|nr:hypothetical protein MVEN_00054100 [Mycena venus]